MHTACKTMLFSRQHGRGLPSAGPTLRERSRGLGSSAKPTFGESLPLSEGETGEADRGPSCAPCFMASGGKVTVAACMLHASVAEIRRVRYRGSHGKHKQIVTCWLALSLAWSQCRTLDVIL